MKTYNNKNYEEAEIEIVDEIDTNIKAHSATFYIDDLGIHKFDKKKKHKHHKEKKQEER